MTNSLRSLHTRRQVLSGLAASALLSSVGADGQTRPASEIVIRYVFDTETHGWIPALSDYSLTASMLEFRAEIRQFPPEFQTDLAAYYLQSRNTPDDLFMFLKKELSAQDGVEPNRDYNISIHVGFLSNAPSGATPGIGGSPGGSVYLKAGISLVEPVAVLENANYVSLNIDKGSQAQSGRDVQVVSTFENGQAQQTLQPYVYVERVHHFPRTVHTDGRGVLWFTVGTESGFEGMTAIYYYTIVITLRPL